MGALWTVFVHGCLDKNLGFEHFRCITSFDHFSCGTMIIADTPEHTTCCLQSTFPVLLIFCQGALVLGMNVIYIYIYIYLFIYLFNIYSLHEGMTNRMITAPSEDQVDVLLGHDAPQCISQKSWRNTSGARTKTQSKILPQKDHHIDWQLSYVEDLVEQPIQSVVVRQCVSTPHGLFKHPTYESRLGHQDDESQPEGADGWINHAGHVDLWATWDIH